MESPNTSLSSLPPAATFPSSPSSSPRKRSIHEVDDATLPSVGPKRTLTAFAGENQENRDPIVLVPTKNASSLHDSLTNKQFTLTISNNVQDSNTGSPVKADMTSDQAAKRQKLSPSSKEAKQQEKEAKDRQKLEEKAKKEEEKRQKADEKRKREAEREEEKRLKEEERKKREAEREEKRKAKEEEKAAKEAAKEDEKRRKEEEKLKKERVRISHFLCKTTASCFTREELFFT